MIKVLLVSLMVLGAPASTPIPVPVVCFEPTHLERVIDNSFSKVKNPYMCRELK